jgi:quercetin dioxygenase-like cupin family protein
MNASRLVAVLLIGGAAPALAEPREESVAPLVQKALPGIAGKQFTAAIVMFPPRARAVPHRHGGAFLYAYVLDGNVRSQIEGEPVRRSPVHTTSSLKMRVRESLLACS